MSLLLARSKTLLIVDDFITHESLDKRRQFLLELTISGRYGNHYLWLLLPSYLTKPNNLRRQAKLVLVLYTKERPDLKTIHDENNVLTEYGLIIVRNFKTSMFVHTK